MRPNVHSTTPPKTPKLALNKLRGIDIKNSLRPTVHKKGSNLKVTITQIYFEFQ
jgi:hypothetical protein